MSTDLKPTVMVLTPEQVASLVKQTIEETLAASLGADILTDTQVCELLDIDSETLRRYCNKANGLPVHKLTSRTFRFFRSEVLEWVRLHGRVAS